MTTVAVLLLAAGLWIATQALGWETAVPVFLALLSAIGAFAVMLHPVTPSAIVRIGLGAAAILALMTAVAVVSTF